MNILKKLKVGNFNNLVVQIKQKNWKNFLNLQKINFYP